MLWLVVALIPRQSGFIDYRPRRIFALLTMCGKWLADTIQAIAELRRHRQHLFFYFPGQRALYSLRPRQNGRLFADDTFKRIFLNENIRISNKKSLKYVPKGLINNFPALVLIMAWRRPGDKPLSETMLVKSLRHICVTRPQWVNRYLCWHGWLLNSILFR